MDRNKKDVLPSSEYLQNPLLAWLRFVHSDLSYAQQRNLLSIFTTPQELFTASVRDWPLSVRKILSRGPDPCALDRDLHWSGRPGCHLIHFDHRHYPPLLKEIYDPPWLLYVRGELASLRRDFIAIVGSRNPSPGGRSNAEEFAGTFAALGWGIVSGLATGIDGAAHRGALNAEAATVAVLGTGPDQIYPRRHADLAEKIVGRGALVSEFAPGTPPLCRAVLVVEAGLRSGSLITARLAAEQGREVCAVPGSIHNPTAKGCHQLIRQGAKLVESANDVLEELGMDTQRLPRPAQQHDATIDGAYQVLARHLGHDPLVIDELIRLSGLTPDAVSSMLLQMEVLGLVESLPGGRYQRSRAPKISDQIR